jgi:hypothetical protein
MCLPGVARRLGRPARQQIQERARARPLDVVKGFVRPVLLKQKQHERLEDVLGGAEQADTNDVKLDVAADGLDGLDSRAPQGLGLGILAAARQDAGDARRASPQRPSCIALLPTS